MSKFNIQKQPNDILVDVAQKVRRLRKTNKWSQEELANRSGVSLGSLKRFESTGQISFIFLLKLANVFGRLEEFESLLVPKETSNLNQLFSDK